MATLILCVATYLLMTVKASRVPEAGGLTSLHIDVLIAYGASWREGVWDGDWYRFLAPLFLHGSLIHIGMNMYSFYHLGPSAEIHFGTTRFGAIFFLSGLGGVCLSQLLGGHVSVGASGSLFGILGAYLAVKVMACHDLQRATKNSEVRETFFFIVLNLALIGFAVPNIDNWGHIGGLLFGFLYGALFEYQRKHRNRGLALLIPCVLLSATLVVACRWMVFNPHYHVHQGILADDAGRTAEAAAHFARAAEWAGWFPSVEAGRAAALKAREAEEQGDWAGRRRYAKVFFSVTPEGAFKKLRPTMRLILDGPRYREEAP